MGELTSMSRETRALIKSLRKAEDTLVEHGATDFILVFGAEGQTRRVLSSDVKPPSQIVGELQAGILAVTVIAVQMAEEDLEWEAEDGEE